jgi:hypothetical protein
MGGHKASDFGKFWFHGRTQVLQSDGQWRCEMDLLVAKYDFKDAYFI